MAIIAIITNQKQSEHCVTNATRGPDNERSCFRAFGRHRRGSVGQMTFGRSGKIAPHGSLSLRALLRVQFAVTSSVNANTFAFRP